MFQPLSQSLCLLRRPFLVAGLVLLLAGLTPLQAASAAESAKAAQAEQPAKAEQADRAALAAKQVQQLFGGTCPFEKTDPEFTAARDRLVFGQIWQRGVLTEEQRLLVTIVTLATVQYEDGVARLAEAALRRGVDPLAIREAIYQVVPYIGYPRAVMALSVINPVFERHGIALPLANQGTVSEETRFADGLAVQKGIFGAGIDAMHAKAPEGQKDIVVDYLSAWCFGDTYTRKVLDLKMRELLTFTVISALGGCESQVKSHVQGNLNVGNSKQLLVDTLAQCLPYIGFPRTLNALACVNAVAGADK